MIIFNSQCKKQLEKEDDSGLILLISNSVLVYLDSTRVALHDSQLKMVHSYHIYFIHHLKQIAFPPCVLALSQLSLGWLPLSN